MRGLQNILPYYLNFMLRPRAKENQFIYIIVIDYASAVSIEQHLLANISAINPSH